MKIFQNKWFDLVLLNIIKYFQITFKVWSRRKQISYRKTKNYNFCGIAYFAHWKCFQGQPFHKAVYIIQHKCLNEVHISCEYSGYCLKLKREKEKESQFCWRFFICLYSFSQVFNDINDNQKPYLSIYTNKVQKYNYFY